MLYLWWGLWVWEYLLTPYNQPFRGKRVILRAGVSADVVWSRALCCVGLALFWMRHICKEQGIILPKMTYLMYLNTSGAALPSPLCFFHLLRLLCGGRTVLGAVSTDFQAEKPDNCFADLDLLLWLWRCDKNLPESQQRLDTLTWISRFLPLWWVYATQLINTNTPTIPHSQNHSTNHTTSEIYSTYSPLK